jgi:hypothetical protein
MKNYKNYLIALLTGLLVLTLTTQPSIGAGTSSTAKAILYGKCLDVYIQGNIDSDYQQLPSDYLVSDFAAKCAKYKP